MKRTVCILLCLLLAVGALAGCQRQEEPSSSLSSASSAPEESQVEEGPYQIGLVQFKEHDALDTMRESFMSRLEEWGCDEAVVEIDYQNAGGDTAQAGEICRKFVEDGVDMIVALSTPAAQAAVAAASGTEVTVLFGGVGDSAALGLEEGEASRKVTGTVTPGAASAWIDLALQLDAQAETLGLLYHSGEADSLSAAEDAKEYAATLGLEVVEATVSEDGEVAQAAADLCGQVDALLTPADNTVAAQAAAVAEAARAAGVPWYGGSDAMARAGALAAVCADTKEVGRKTADMAVELLQGRSLEEVPVYTFTETQTYLNQTTLEALENLSVPQEIQESAYVYQ